MLQKRHYISIVVNGNEVELENQESLNLRINNVIFNPTEINSKQGEYSFSFNLPITNKNSKIFSYSNNLSKVNKFNKKYECVVYADGTEIFNGKLIVKSISDEYFKCNIYTAKLNTLDDILGDSVLTNIKWEVPFESYETINDVNADLTTKYYFPLASYGVFQKVPSSTSYDINSYSPIHLLDNTTRFYWETFIPSHNLLEVVKKCFEYKGFECRGTIFEDAVANSIYLSSNLKSEQQPYYNLGNPNFGKLVIDYTWSNWKNMNNGSNNRLGYLENDLTHQYDPYNSEYKNFEKVCVYDMWSTDNNKYNNIENNGFMFRETDNCIVIPSDGLYAIEMDATFDINNADLSKNVLKYYWNNEIDGVDQHTVNVSKSWNNFPIEIQLVRNTNDEIELIHGPIQENGTTTNYPHEATNSTSSNSNRTMLNQAIVTLYNRGYQTKINELMAYDPWVSENFICGFSSISTCPAVMKNGYSWNNTIGVKNNVRYSMSGYWGVNNENGVTTFTKTSFNSNALYGAADNYCSSIGTYSKKGKVSLVMELKKNDIISLKAVTRFYELENGTINDYNINVSGKLTFRALSPKGINEMDSGRLDFQSNSQFGDKLNLANFLNQETKMVDFVNNVIKALNLEFIQEGNIVYLNKQFKNINDVKYCVNIDDRVNSKEATSEPINYPSSIQVKYSIDTEEEGFYQSVSETHINDDDWTDWGEYGSEKIKLVDSDEAKAEEVTLNNSYCWYDDFTLVNYDSYGNEIDRVTLNLPVQAKTENMIEGANYEEMAKQDGRSLKQRWWFRVLPTQYKVNMMNKYPINLSIPQNTNGYFTLNYYKADNTLLTNYFNILPMADSNFVEVECYLSPMEYKSLRNGANVIFDSDVYLTSEISGYDPTGNNKAKLKLIKKT